MPDQSPLELQNTTAVPNVMILLDNSGSMTDPVSNTGNTRLYDAKSVLSDLIDDHSDGSIRFCGATFAHYVDIFDNDSNVLNSYGSGAYMNEKMQCSNDSTKLEALKTVFTNVATDPGYIDPYGGTPLAEAVYDITRYFRVKGPYFGLFTNEGTRYSKHSSNLLAGTSNQSGTPFADPIIYECQENLLIVITDGEPSVDWEEGIDRATPFSITNADDPPATPISPPNPKLPNWDEISTDDNLNQRSKI